MRVDRADGFVGRNWTTRGGLEFGFYVEETDGVLLDRTKFFWNADYGHLSFTTDHNQIQNCDGMGAGDAAIYPGRSAGDGRPGDRLLPGRPASQHDRHEVRHAQPARSATRARWATPCASPTTTSTATRPASRATRSRPAGHPGFPADSAQIDNNFIYSNNFDVYAEDSPVDPLVSVPIGTGVIWAGLNDGNVKDNWFFDNWRSGHLLLAVPDALTSAGGAEGDIYPGVSCPGAPDNGLSTSCSNSFSGNKMGQVPPGFEFPAALDQFDVPHGTINGSEPLPNGVDFWWDEFLGNTGNCWFDNTGFDGNPDSVTGAGEAGPLPSMPPNPLPDCSGGEDPSSSTGQGDPAKEQYLVDCSRGPGPAPPEPPPITCDWWTPPEQPGTPAAARAQAEVARAARAFAHTAEADRLRQRMEALAAGAGG